MENHISPVSSIPLTGPPPRLLIVEACFYPQISAALLEGARKALEKTGASYEKVTMPGALEIPLAIAMAHHAAKKFDGYVALGCVIRGETTHYEIVSGQSCRALMDLGVAYGLAIGNGILTVENEAQAFERARMDRQDKGGGAARASLSLIAWKRHLKSAVA